MSLSAHRRLLIAGCTLMLSAPSFTFAQEDIEPHFLFRPHCEQANALCPAFEIQDPKTLRTTALQAGSTLDIDIILQNPGGKAIRSVRTWLSYDPEALEGVVITPSPEFSVPIPGELDFVPKQGLAKIGLAAVDGSEPKADVIIVARLQWKTRVAPAGGRSPISFYDVREGTKGHTFIVSTEDPETNLITGSLGSLMVQWAGAIDTPADTSATPSDETLNTGSGSGTASSGVGAGASFTLLQVQNVRTTSEGNTVYVAWDPLKTLRLQGYNVYYGTTMGRYIQRRSLPASAQSISLRDLPKGTTYYVSVRAVGDSGQESAFSQEVGVEVGKPSTSTAPLLSIPREGDDNVQAPSNPVAKPGRNPNSTVPGEAGFGSTMAIFVVLSAVIGTLLAVRRQAVALSVHSHD